MRVYKFILIFFLLLISISSCITTKDQARNRINYLIKKFPGVIDTTTKVRIDTLIIEKLINKNFSDSNASNKTYQTLNAIIDSLLNNSWNDTVIISDTVYIKSKFKIYDIDRVKNDLKNACNIENLITPITYDTLGVYINITPNKNALKIKIKSKDLIVKKNTEKIPNIKISELKFYEDLWFYAFILTLILLIIIIIKRK